MQLEKNTKSDKTLVVAPQQLANIAKEFGIEQNEQSLVIKEDQIKAIRSIEEEETHYDTFFVKESGFVYVGAPAIPLPLKIELSQNSADVTISVLPLTPEYGIVHARGTVNFVRNIRFFVNEIVNYALHYTENQPQLTHPESLKA